MNPELTGETVYRWPATFKFSKWFSNKRPENLDHDDLTNLRYAVSIKVSKIFCLASERLAKLDIFKSLPKTEKFVMKVQNRTAGTPPIFILLIRTKI